MKRPGVVPPTIEELNAEAKDYPYSKNVSCRNWLHVAKTLLREADHYQIGDVNDEDRNDAYAYALYLRFSDLILEKLNKHPEVGRKENAAKYRAFVDELKRIVPKIESLNKLLKQDRKDWEDNQDRIKHQKEQHQSRVQQNAKRQPLPSHPNTQPNQHLPQRPSEYSDEAYKTTLKQLRELHSKASKPASLHSRSEQTNTGNYHHPAVDYPHLPHHRSALDVYRVSQTTSYDTQADDRGPVLPRRPTKREDSLQLDSKSSDVGPALPHRPDGVGHVHADYGDGTGLRTGPSESPEATQNETMHKIKAYTEGHEPLRTVFVPGELQNRFLDIAHSNTVKNLETCGILCGKLLRNAFFITHLVIPRQTSTSDTCATSDEELLLEYIDSNDLFILGWIHTHPTQTCFMSSVDLHTQSSYQIMLAEAIAIVCAPRHEENIGFFRLTNPPGIDVIKACRNPAQFHHHPERNIYTSAHPGHVRINSKIPFTVKDLR